MKAIQIIAESELMAETFSIVTIHSTFFFQYLLLSFFSLCVPFFFTITYGSFFFFYTDWYVYIVDIVLYRSTTSTWLTIKFLTQFFSHILFTLLLFSNVPLYLSLSFSLYVSSCFSQLYLVLYIQF